MVRRCLPIAILFFSCVSVDAQAPLAPFTARDLELGKKIVATSAEIRPQIADPSAPAEPFKVIGNLYMVGDTNGGAYLLTSPQGHILLGTGFVNAAESIQKNIESLGFKMSDIKVILLNHSHPDVAGGAAYMKEKTGAQIMSGFAEIPYLEHRNPAPPAPNVGGRGQEKKKEAPNLGARGGGGRPTPAVKVDRALYDGDVVKVGPLSITTYLAPGHSPSSASWLFNVKDGGHTYRVIEFCCWEFPDDISRSPYINEASVRHTFDTWAKLLPIDIYLENGLYGWAGMLNQPSGTFVERLAKLKTDPKLNIDRNIFRAYAAAREVEFQEKLANVKASN